MVWLQDGYLLVSGANSFRAMWCPPVTTDSESPRSVYIDLTNTVAVPFTTGIQRVTRELLRRFLAEESCPFLFHPLVYSPFFQKWRHVAPGERRYLLGGARGEVWRSAAFWLDTLAGRLPARSPSPPRSRAGVHWKAGSIFLDIDSAWHSRPSRSLLLPQLRQAGVDIACLHYDLTPLLFPEYAHPQTVLRYAEYIGAHLQRTGLFLCISEAVAQDLRRYRQQAALHASGSIRTLQLGADHLQTAAVHGLQMDALPRQAGQPNRKFLLAVGTLEPRKNFTMLLDVFTAMAAEYPGLDLLIVGRAGWKSDELQQRLRTHPLANKRVFWLQGLSDASLASLYAKAFLVVVPSFYEGFGLPVVEALHHGAVVLSSNRGALPEAGGDLALYFDPDAPEQLTALLRRQLMDPGDYQQRQARARDYRLPGWDRTAQQAIQYLAAFAAGSLGCDEQ